MNVRLYSAQYVRTVFITIFSSIICYCLVSILWNFFNLIKLNLESFQGKNFSYKFWIYFKKIVCRFFFLIYILDKLWIMESNLFFIFHVYILNILTLFFLHKIEIVRSHHFFFKNCILVFWEGFCRWINVRTIVLSTL